MYLLVDSTSNIVQWAAESMPTSIPSGQVLATVSDTDPNAQGVQSRPTDYTYSGGVLARRPYFTLAYDHTANVLTATLNDVPTTLPASVTFAVAGQTFTSAPTSTTDATTNVTTVTAKASISVHPALQPYSVVVSVSADGFVSNSIDVGNTTKNPPVAIQAYQATGSTTYTVAPSNATSTDKLAARSFIQAYYGLSIGSVPTVFADLLTGMSLLLDFCFNVQTPPTLTADQQNTVTKLKTLQLYTTMATAAPATGTAQLQFTDFLNDFEKAITATHDYNQDLVTFGY